MIIDYFHFRIPKFLIILPIIVKLYEVVTTDTFVILVFLLKLFIFQKSHLNHVGRLNSIYGYGTLDKSI